VQRGYQRWYYDPLPGDDIAPATDEDEAYPSVSAVKKASGGDWSFVTRRRLAQAVAADPDVFRGLSDVTEIADRMRAIDQADLRPGDDIAQDTCEDGACRYDSAAKKAPGGDSSVTTRRRLPPAVAARPELSRGLCRVTEIPDPMRAIAQADLRRASERGTNVH